MIHALGYAGLLPFVGLAYLSWHPVVLDGPQAVQLFHVYSCLILGFMAGVLWPVLYRPQAPARMALLAVTFPIASFLAFALLPSAAALIQAALFLTLRGCEALAGIDARYSSAYRSLRWQLTAVVVLSHLPVALAA